MDYWITNWIRRRKGETKPLNNVISRNGVSEFLKFCSDLIQFYGVFFFIYIYIVLERTHSFKICIFLLNVRLLVLLSNSLRPHLLIKWLRRSRIILFKWNRFNIPKFLHCSPKEISCQTEKWSYSSVEKPTPLMLPSPVDHVYL